MLYSELVKIEPCSYHCSTIDWVPLILFTLLTTASFVLSAVLFVYSVTLRTNSLLYFATLLYQLVVRLGEIAVVIHLKLIDEHEFPLGSSFTVSLFLFNCVLLLFQWEDHNREFSIPREPKSYYSKIIGFAMVAFFVAWNNIIISMLNMEEISDSTTYVFDTLSFGSFGIAYVICPLLVAYRFKHTISYFDSFNKQLFMMSCCFIFVFSLTFRGIMDTLASFSVLPNEWNPRYSDNLQFFMEGIPVLSSIPLAFFQPTSHREHSKYGLRSSFIHDNERTNLVNYYWERLISAFDKLQCYIPNDEVIINSRIADGSYAKIYEGVLQKKVAIKQFKIPVNLGGEDLAQLMKKETEIMRSLAHPNIIRFYGITITKEKLDDIERIYVNIISSLASDGTLEDFLLNNEDCGPQFWEHITYRVAKDTAEGMVYLHNMKIAHLDLKPANLLVDVIESHEDIREEEDIHIIITDFGLSSILSGSRRDFDNLFDVGTVRYNAPEVGDVVLNPYKIDVYAYGCVLWELVTKQESMGKHCASMLKKLRRSHKTHPLFNVISACLQKQPLKRWTFVEIKKEIRNSY
eukprot:TRINITY_DN9253_c0_g1_i1.p1 TRINITY_DN9253_c0_g1~~TRINITY_DN9253_c0_g1_i1.p1  ORF type:complete len:575 (-),score=81.44 TRINITY_DN9253_c0_g1_i1:39-1763(-)